MPVQRGSHLRGGQVHVRLSGSVVGHKTDVPRCLTTRVLDGKRQGFCYTQPGACSLEHKDSQGRYSTFSGNIMIIKIFDSIFSDTDFLKGLVVSALWRLIQ